jgi:hypothetical protein
MSARMPPAGRPSVLSLSRLGGGSCCIRRFVWADVREGRRRQSRGFKPRKTVLTNHMRLYPRVRISTNQRRLDGVTAMRRIQVPFWNDTGARHLGISPIH